MVISNYTFSQIYVAILDLTSKVLYNKIPSYVIDHWCYFRILVAFNKKNTSFLPLSIINPVSPPWCVFLSLSPPSLIPLSPSLPHTCVNIVLSVSMCVCGSGAALLAGGGGERERKSSERGKEIHTQRSKAFTGTKHAVSISQIRAAYSPLIYLKADYSSCLQYILFQIINLIMDNRINTFRINWLVLISNII